MSNLRSTSSVISNHMISVIGSIRRMGTTMDARLFSYNTVVSQFLGILNNLHTDSPRNLNDILTDLVSVILPLARSSEKHYLDAQFLVSVIIFKHKGRDTISPKSFDLLYSQASLLKELEEDQIALLSGSLFAIKNKKYVIIGPMALGTDYWIYEQDQLDKRESLTSVPSYRISDLMPLKSSDFKHEGIALMEDN